MSAIQAFADDLLLGVAPAPPGEAPAREARTPDLQPTPAGAPRERPSRWTFVFDRWAALSAPVEEFVLA